MSPSPTPAVPAAQGVRMEWAALPSRVRERVEERIGARVVGAVTQKGGFSPGVAARVRLADGGRVFVKAVGVEPNGDAPGLHRAEARVAGALPAGAPVARLLGVVEVDGWVALVFEDVAGRTPAQPWRSAELARVLAASAGLAALLDPAPLPAPTLAERNAEPFRGWRLLAAERADVLAGLGPWARRHLARLAAAEPAWVAASAGSALVHCDLRADNVLLTADRVVFVDWPWASIGVPWFDVLALGPSVIAWNGPSAVPVLDAHLAARGADPEAVTALLVALAGRFLHQSTLPAPPGLPTLRPFQRAQGEGALTWLRSRPGWR
jgi:hypothetical protein